MKQQRYCPFCGEELIVPTQYAQPIPQCPECNYLGLNAPRPVVLTLVYKGEDVLLARSPHFREGAYGLFAGHVEFGESAESAAVREVREESNVECVIRHYMGSFPIDKKGQLCLTYVAEYLCGEATAGDDVSEVKWFSLREDLPEHGVISAEVITRFKRQNGIQ